MKNDYENKETSDRDKLIEKKWDLEFQIEDARAEKLSLRARLMKVELARDIFYSDNPEKRKHNPGRFRKINSLGFDIREKEAEIMSLQAQLKKIITSINRIDREAPRALGEYRGSAIARPKSYPAISS